MYRTAVLTACVMGLCLALGGCGSGGRVGSPGDVQTITFGPLRVGIEATANGLQTLPLASPTYSSVAFTVLYGAKIVQLESVSRSGKIAFGSMRDGDMEIYSMSPDGSNQTRLTNSPGNDFVPAWSPDGSKIAFASARDGNTEVYVMNANGSGQTRLTNNPAMDSMPAWSPDGQRIAFISTRDGDWEIYVMKSDGSGQTRLTNSPNRDTEPTWSADGRRIAFTSYRTGDQEIYVMNADGTGQVNLTNNSAQDLLPAWSPDGLKIAFESDRCGGGDSDIYVMSVDGSNVRDVSDFAGGVDGHPSWSPDGQDIAFETYRGDSEIYAIDGAGYGPAIDLTCHGGDDLWPDWGSGAAVDRVLIGGSARDGGANPPFGAQRPLVVVGLVQYQGLAGAATVQLPVAAWGTLTATALDYQGGSLVGLQLNATQLVSVLEDRGRGLPATVWSLGTNPVITQAVVMFGGYTGKIQSVIGSSDAVISATRKVAVESVGGRLVLRGSFTCAFDARDPSRNRLTGPTQQVVLDAKTGQVIGG